jgi:hypothetical protein
LLRQQSAPRLKPMEPLRSKKLRQLCGMGALAAYVLVKAWWLTSVSPDDTNDDTLIWLLVGAPVAFAVGWFLGPMIGDWISPQTARKRRHRHRRRSSPADSTKPGEAP